MEDAYVVVLTHGTVIYHQAKLVIDFGGVNFSMSLVPWAHVIMPIYLLLLPLLWINHKVMPYIWTISNIIFDPIFMWIHHFGTIAWLIVETWRHNQAIVFFEDS